jgi:head-tail adaptor
MSDQDDWDFAGADDAKMTIRAAIRYLLKGVPGSDRGDVVSQIIEVVRQAVHDVPLDSSDPFDDELPGG